MAYGDEFTETNVPRRSIDRSKPVDKKKNRQSLSEHLFKSSDSTAMPMKRSVSQQSLKQDIALEAVMIDLPSLDNTYAESNEDLDELTPQLSRWGPVRGSNSYSSSSEVPVSQLSTLNLKRSVVQEKDEKHDSSV